MTITRTAFLALTALAAGIAHGDSAPLWGPHIDIEAKPGSKRTLGEVDLFLPLSQDARTLVFGNLRARLDNQSSYEGNFGAGVRRMYDGGWNVGAYGYWDHRRSGNGNFFDQATLGAEALGRDWDFRANAYLPVGTRAYALSPESTAAVSGASVQVSTAFREERALKGFDAEAGWRAPIFESEASRQLRLYVGGYRFSDVGTIVEGPRLRAELALDELPWFGKGTRLFLSAEMQDDNARGGQSFLGVRLRIPLGEERASARSLTAQERRMTAPVMRDVDIVTQNRVASTQVETATQTAGGQAVTVLDSATTTTAAALQTALDTAGAGTVILSGTFNTSANNGTTISLSPGQTLMGTGSLTVRSPSGHVATLTKTSTATISGTYSAGSKAIVQMANDSTLSGVILNQTGSGDNGQWGVYANGKTGVVISNNTISVQNDQNAVYGVYLTSGSTATVSGNSITVFESNAGGGFAWGVRIDQSSAIIAGNTISATSNTAGRASSVYRRIGIPGSPAAFASGSTGNTFTTSAGCGDDGSTRSGTLYYTNSVGVATSCQ